MRAASPSRRAGLARRRMSNGKWGPEAGDPFTGTVPASIPRGRLEFSRDGELLRSRPPLSHPDALGTAADRLRHTVRFSAETQDLVHITLYHWLGENLWTQEAHFLPSPERVDVVLAPPLRCFGVPNDQPLLEMAMAHLDDVVLVTEAEPLDVPGPRVVYANPAFTRMTGYDIDEIIGKTPRILQGEGSEPEAIQKMGRALRSWKPVRVEVTNYRKDGTPFVVELDLRPIADATGWYTHWVSVQRDVTGRRLAEARELRLERLETIAMLTGGIAHDFNNLLVGMLGNLELAKEQIEPGTDLAALVGEAEDAALRSKSLTRQLMTFSRDAPPGGVTPSRFELGGLVREVTDFSLRGTGVRATYRVAEGGGWVDADRTQIGQVVASVVINAVEAMGGRGSLDIVVGAVGEDDLPEELDRAESYAQARFEDDGPGVAEYEVHRIFEPYFSTESRGSGIGLAVSRTILKWNRGAIRAARAPGGGLAVEIFLPAGAPVAAASSRVPTGSHGLDAVRGLRVVWMDDDPMVRSVAQRLGRHFDWSLETVPRGEAVLERLEEAGAAPDLVVLDLTVRDGLGGLETLRRLRVVRPDLPVLLASGWCDTPLGPDVVEDDRLQAIAKPFRAHELSRVVAALMSRAGGGSFGPT